MGMEDVFGYHHLEEDSHSGYKLTFYGECTGVETYRTVLGGSVTIPAMDAKYYK